MLFQPSQLNPMIQFSWNISLPAQESAYFGNAGHLCEPRISGHRKTSTPTGLHRLWWLKAIELIHEERFRITHELWGVKGLNAIIETLIYSFQSVIFITRYYELYIGTWWFIFHNILLFLFCLYRKFWNKVYDSYNTVYFINIKKLYTQQSINNYSMSQHKTVLNFIKFINFFMIIHLIFSIKLRNLIHLIRKKNYFSYF